MNFHRGPRGKKHEGIGRKGSDVSGKEGGNGRKKGKGRGGGRGGGNGKKITIYRLDAILTRGQDSAKKRGKVIVDQGGGHRFHPRGENTHRSKEDQLG